MATAHDLGTYGSKRPPRHPPTSTATFIYHPPRASFFSLSFLSSLKALIAFSIFIPPVLHQAEQIKRAIEWVGLVVTLWFASDFTFCMWAPVALNARGGCVREGTRCGNYTPHFTPPRMAHLRMSGEKWDPAFNRSRFRYLNISSQVFPIASINRF